jgi:hypothetical protein
MSTVQNIASTAPIAALSEPRSIQGSPSQGQAPLSKPVEPQGRTTVADEVQIKALEARDAARTRTQESKDRAANAEQPAQYASKVGLVDGTLDAFVDIVDARFQRRIARIFGPSEAPPAPAADISLDTVRKAYETVPPETPSGGMRQSA